MQYDTFKRFLVLGMERDTLKCNRKASGWLNQRYMNLKQ